MPANKQIIERNRQPRKEQSFYTAWKSLCNSQKEALSNIKNIYGGMGSFNDLVLYKDGKIDIEANEKFGALRENLYKAVLSEIIELRS